MKSEVFVSVLFELLNYVPACLRDFASYVHLHPTCLPYVSTWLRAFAFHVLMCLCPFMLRAYVRLRPEHRLAILQHYA